MMQTVNVIDPSTGQAHAIPYDQLPHALKAGGQFADEDQKQKAIKIQDGSYDESEESKPLELELTQGRKPKEATGWKALGADAIRLLGNTLKSGVGFARRLPGNVEEVGSELLHHPLSYPPHVAQQVLAGLGEGAKGLANIPHEIFDELANKEITPNWLRTGSIPEDTGVEKFLGLEPTKKSDELLRALPALYGGGQLVGKGISKAKKVATAPSKEKLFQRALETRVSEAAEKAGVSESSLKSLQDALKLDYSNIHGEKLGQATPTALQEGINVKQHKLAENKPLTEIPEREVGEIPEKPDTKGMLAEHQELINKAKADAESTVGIKTNPGKQVGKAFQSSMEDLEKSSGDIYNAARDYYEDKNIMADNSSEIKEAASALKELSANEEFFEGIGSERTELLNTIKSLESEQVKASKVYAAMRTSQQLANKARMKRKGATESEWNRLTELGDRLDRHADKLAKRLEEVGGQDVRAMIKQANQGYKTFKELTVGKFEKGVFKTNPVAKEAFKTGNVPNHAMSKLADDLPGNKFLNELVQSDPELRKNLLAAYSGESNINKLTNPNSLTKKYLESLPEVEDKLIAFKKAVADYKGKEQEAAKIDKAHSELVKSMKEAAKEQKIRKDAIKESAEIEKQIKFKQDALPKIEAQMKEVERNSVEHKRLQKVLEDHKKFIQDKGGRLKELAKFFVKVKLAGKVHL